VCFIKPLFSGFDVLPSPPTLRGDDIAGLHAGYRPSADLGNGALTGVVQTEQGTPILGAHAVAVDASGVARIDALEVLPRP
jgi:hypothetical protein